MRDATEYDLRWLGWNWRRTDRERDLLVHGRIWRLPSRRHWLFLDLCSSKYKHRYTVAVHKHSKHTVMPVTPGLIGNLVNDFAALYARGLYPREFFEVSWIWMGFCLFYAIFEGFEIFVKRGLMQNLVNDWRPFIQGAYIRGAYKCGITIRFPFCYAVTLPCLSWLLTHNIQFLKTILNLWINFCTASSIYNNI